MTDPVDTNTQGVADVERALLIKDVEFWIAQADTWKRLANDERAVSGRLRAVIENAPHDSLCNHPLECRCWKADAL